MSAQRIPRNIANFLLLLLSAALGLALLGFFARPLKARPLDPADFRGGSGPTGYVFAKLPNSLQEGRRYTLAPRVWLAGTAVEESSSIQEMEASSIPAYRIKEGLSLYINRALLDRIQKSPAESVLGLDLPGSLSRGSQICSAAFLLLTLWVVLTPYRSPTLAPDASRTRRLPALDSLRGIAAFSVMLFHALGLFYPRHWFSYAEANTAFAIPEIAQWMQTPPFSIILNGSLMVHIFWVLSGFVLATPLLGKASYELTARAAVRRYFRLMPLACITVLASFILHLSGGYFVQEYNAITRFGVAMITMSGEAGMGIPRVVADAFFFGSGLNMPLWTIKLEYVGSLVLFGLIALTLPLARRRLVWWLFLLAMLLVWPQMFLVDFAAGLLLAEAVIKRPQFTLHKAPTFALLAVAIILGSVSSGFPGPWVPRLGRFYALPTLLSAFLLVYLAVRSPAVVSLLHCRPLVWLGERSFALYAIHALTIHSVGQGISVLCLKAGISPLGSAAVGLIICFAVTFWLSDWLTKAIDLPSVAFSNSVGKWFAGVPSALAGKEAVATPTDLPPALVSSPMRE